MQNLPKPDLIFYLKPINPNVIKDRNDFGNERYDNLEYQSKIYDLYEKFLINSKDGFNFKILDSTLSIEEISKLVIEHLKHSSFFQSNLNGTEEKEL